MQFRLVGQVCRLELRAVMALSLDFVSHGLEALLGGGGQQQLDALTGQVQGYGPADTATGPSDQGRLS